MLRCFEVLTKKEAVRKALEKKTEGTLILFHSQIADSRSRFDRNRLSPTLMDDEPTFAGAASWARGMKRRIEHDWALLQQARPWLPKVSESFGAMRWVLCSSVGMSAVTHVAMFCTVFLFCACAYPGCWVFDS
jgi:hypothetical protein